MKNKIEFIAFDADDTLWDNELFSYEFETRFSSIIKTYLPNHSVSEELLDTEIRNLPLYGYGVKGMMLCMIELTCKIVDPEVSAECISEIIRLGKELLQKPVNLLDGVAEVLTELHKTYKLVLATKGDLLDQERKINKSGLAAYFHHIEIMSDKRTSDYLKLIKYLGCKSEHFMMIGNSMKSDIIPVLESGAFAAHVPYPITWGHEKCNENIRHPNFIQINNITEILDYL